MYYVVWMDQARYLTDKTQGGCHGMGGKDLIGNLTIYIVDFTSKPGASVERLCTWIHTTMTLCGMQRWTE